MDEIFTDKAMMAEGGAAPPVDWFTESAQASGIDFTHVNGATIRDVCELAGYLKERQIDVGIVAVPGKAAQGIVETLVAGGVRSILNYAPIAAHVPRGVTVRRGDLRVSGPAARPAVNEN